MQGRRCVCGSNSPGCFPGKISSIFSPSVCTAYFFQLIVCLSLLPFKSCSRNRRSLRNRWVPVAAPPPLWVVYTPSLPVELNRDNNWSNGPAVGGVRLTLDVVRPLITHLEILKRKRSKEGVAGCKSLADQIPLKIILKWLFRSEVHFVSDQIKSDFSIFRVYAQQLFLFFLILLLPPPPLLLPTAPWLTNGRKVLVLPACDHCLLRWWWWHRWQPPFLCLLYFVLVIERRVGAKASNSSRRKFFLSLWPSRWWRRRRWRRQRWGRRWHRQFLLKPIIFFFSVSLLRRPLLKNICLNYSLVGRALRKFNSE